MSKTYLEKLKDLQAKLDADPNFVDFKCTPGIEEDCKNATDEEIARDVLILLGFGPNKGIDISNEIL